MKKAVSIAIVIVIILTLCSCSAKKTSGISVISSMYSASDGYINSKKFSYNKDGNISEILETYSDPDGNGYIWKTVFEYNNNGCPQKSIKYRDGEIIYWYDYKCNYSKKIIEARKYTSDSFKCYIEYIYNSDGTLSNAKIYDGNSDLCCKFKYSYNDAGNIIFEEQLYSYKYSLVNWNTHNFSYSYSPNSDSKLISFSVSNADSEEYRESESYNLEYDSNGNLTKSIVAMAIYGDIENIVTTYQHTVIDVTKKTNLFMSDSGSYYNPFFGVFDVQERVNNIL